MTFLRASLLGSFAGLALVATIAAAAANQTGAPSEKAIAAGLKMRGLPTLGTAPAPKPGARPGTQPAALHRKTAGRPAVSLSTIRFDFASARLEPDSIATLKNLGNALNHELKNEKKFLIEGHTDSYGTPAYNLLLSKRRADAVKDYLVSVMRVSAARLETAGKGASEPADPKNPFSPANRRVVVINLGAL